MKFCAEPRHLGGNACGKRVPRNRLQHVAQQAVRIICRSQSAREGIERGKFSIVFELPSKRHARSPVARGAAVISKALGEVILKVVRGGERGAAPARHRYMPGVVLEPPELKKTALAL